MNIPWRDLQPETLQSVIEEFVSRCGTDYGQEEVSFDSKVQEVYRLLKNGKARLVFDAENESCDIREVSPL